MARKESGFTRPTPMTRLLSIGNQLMNLTNETWVMKAGSSPAQELGTQLVNVIGVSLNRSVDPPEKIFYVTQDEVESAEDTKICTAHQTDFDRCNFKVKKTWPD